MKINNEYVVGEVKQIRPQIFAVAIKDPYQRAMLFCRYIEYYDSPYEEIESNFFTWEKFMMIYRRETENDTFTYGEDWAGFAIASDMLERAMNIFSRDKGPYDEIMGDIYQYCSNRFPNPKKEWHLIGTDNFSSTTLDHEVAHGLYQINDEYRKNCDELIAKIDKEDYKSLKKKLIDMDYMDDKETIDDEIQAWMSTGLSNGLDTKTLKKYQSDFVRNFEKFNVPLNNENRMSLKNLLPRI